MPVVVSVAQGGTGADNAANARINLGVAPSAAYDAANNRVLKTGDTMTGQLNISSGGLLVTGNVGIGTASPGARLDVNAGATALAARVQGTNSPYLSVLDNNDNVEALVASDGFAGVTVFGSITNHPVQIRTNNSERLRIDSSGNVGIAGTPTARLTIYSPGANTGANTIEMYTSNNILRTTISDRGAQNWFLQTNDGIEVGSIRYATPDSRPGISFRDLAGNSRSDIRLIAGGGIALAAGSTSSAPTEWFFVANNGAITLGSQMKTVVTTGSIAGGTSGNSVGFNHAGVYIDRTWADYPGISVMNQNGAGNSNQGQFRFHGTNATFNSYPNSSGSDFSVQVWSDGGFFDASDRRFKTNITTIQNALSVVMSLTGRRFQTINREGVPETDATQSGYKIGFIAQEVQEAGLHDIYRYHPEDDDNTDGYNKAYAIHYGSITALLVEAIKELKNEIDQLKQAK